MAVSNDHENPIKRESSGGRTPEQLLKRPRLHSPTRIRSANIQNLPETGQPRLLSDVFGGTPWPDNNILLRFINDKNEVVRATRSLADCNTIDKIIANARIGGLVKKFAVVRASVVGTAKTIPLVDDHDLRDLTIFIAFGMTRQDSSWPVVIQIQGYEEDIGLMLQPEEGA